MSFCFILLDVGGAMLALTTGFLILFLLFMLPFVSIAESWVFHRAGYNSSLKKCYWHSLVLNLIFTGIFMVFLFNPFFNPDSIRHLLSNFLILFLMLIAPFLSEFLLIRFFNSSFDFSRTRKFFFLRMGFKCVYLILFFVVAYLPVGR